MILQHLNNDTVGLKVAGTAVNIKDQGQIRIGERALEGPGEYDIAGVGVHALSDHAILFTEGVRLALVWGTDTKFNSDDDTNIDVFIFLIADAKQITAMVKEQDPRLVILHHPEVADEIASQDGVVVQKESNYKLSATSLPAEERVFVLLV